MNEDRCIVHYGSTRKPVLIRLELVPVALSLPLDVLHHQHHDGEAVEHEDKEDVEVGMTVVLVHLRMCQTYSKLRRTYG